MAAATLIAPGSLALIRVTFTGAAQARAFGTWAALTAWPAIVVPFIAGVLVDALSWRSVFLLNLPVIAFALWVVWRRVPESRDPAATGRFHWAGAAVVAVAVGGLAFGPIYGQQREWRDPLAPAVLAAGVLATLALPAVMARSTQPLVPLDLFRARAFTAANASTLLIYGSLGTSYTYLALYLQGAAGYSAAATGLALMPGPVLIALFAGRAGALAARYGPRLLTVAGPLVMALRTDGSEVRSADPAVRRQMSPLNAPHEDAPPQQAQAVRVASTDAFRVAMAAGGALFVLAAAVNAVGLHDKGPGRRAPRPFDPA